MSTPAWLLLLSPLIAWAMVYGWALLVDAARAIDRWADRHVADAFHGADVAYGPDLRRMDEAVERALREGER